MPTTAAPPGRSPSTYPATTGTAAESSAVIGATTLIWPDRQALVEQADAGGAAEPAERADHEVARRRLAGHEHASTR